ncbi:hypothetical protein E2C01_005955 [Portunus trituberculatus]|uniref:Uncharacterized protein n=1 Tax=Portunus trituberculatus TaxID=210409 RepID=A0A5B7CUW9_PORTR|nr:hypothetical protein [Portunus trituberculatus]
MIGITFSHNFSSWRERAARWLPQQVASRSLSGDERNNAVAVDRQIRMLPGGQVNGRAPMTPGYECNASSLIRVWVRQVCYHDSNCVSKEKSSRINQ